MEKDLKDENTESNVDFIENEIGFKIIVVGDSGVGKTSITSNAIRKIFEEKYSPTLGFEFYTYNLKIDDKKIKLQIWDTCGQEAYKALICSFYRNASLAILVYSINSLESFESINKWINEIKKKSNPDIKMILIGNKIDLEDERKVTQEMGEKFSKDNVFSLFMETSAKNSINTENLFNEAARILYEKYKEIKEIKEMKNLNIDLLYQRAEYCESAAEHYHYEQVEHDIIALRGCHEKRRNLIGGAVHRAEQRNEHIARNTADNERHSYRNARDKYLLITDHTDYLPESHTHGTENTELQCAASYRQYPVDKKSYDRHYHYHHKAEGERTVHSLQRRLILDRDELL